MKIKEIIQLTEQGAIEYYESKKWETLTDKEKIKLQLYQDRLCMPFREFQHAMIRVLQRPVFTNEFSSTNRDSLTKEFEALNL